MKVFEIFNPKFNNVVFKGSKKPALNYLRDMAKEKRRSSRAYNNLPDSVMPIDRSSHQSELVTIASFKISSMDFRQLLPLLNGHGQLQYDIRVINN